MSFLSGRAGLERPGGWPWWKGKGGSRDGQRGEKKKKKKKKEEEEEEEDEEDDEEEEEEEEEVVVVVAVEGPG